jgi:hypothetical protein
MTVLADLTYMAFSRRWLFRDNGLFAFKDRRIFRLKRLTWRVFGFNGLIAAGSIPKASRLERKAAVLRAWDC